MVKEDIVMATTPDWYWKNGLHDAEIIGIEKYELDYDYTKRNPLRNYILISLNAKGAMFDTHITSIKLYNAKMLTEKIDYSGFWWVGDELAFVNGKYLLKIDIAKAKCNSTVEIQFDTSEVERNRT